MLGRKRRREGDREGEEGGRTHSGHPSSFTTVKTNDPNHQLGTSERLCNDLHFDTHWRFPPTPPTTIGPPLPSPLQSHFWQRDVLMGLAIDLLPLMMVTEDSWCIGMPPHFLPTCTHSIIFLHSFLPFFLSVFLSSLTCFLKYTYHSLLLFFLLLVFFLITARANSSLFFSL